MLNYLIQSQYSYVTHHNYVFPPNTIQYVSHQLYYPHPGLAGKLFILSSVLWYHNCPVSSGIKTVQCQLVSQLSSAVSPFIITVLHSLVSQLSSVPLNPNCPIFPCITTVQCSPASQLYEVLLYHNCPLPPSITTVQCPL